MCGARGGPGTVAPFRAWRGSRDLVAQSPKFHAPALASISREFREKSSIAPPAQPQHAATGASLSFFDDFFFRSRVSRADQDFGFAAAADGASGGCTSDGFTQFTLNGPAPGTCTIVSPLLIAKCRISFGIVTKFPTFMVVSFVSSKVSPMPARKVPFSTVTFSSLGCQCAGILAPSTHRRRTTNGAPSALGSPATVARSHPLKIGVHFKSPKCIILGGAGLSFFSCP